MMIGAIQAHQAKKEQLIQVGQHHKMINISESDALCIQILDNFFDFPFGKQKESFKK